MEKTDLQENWNIASLGYSCLTWDKRGPNDFVTSLKIEWQGGPSQPFSIVEQVKMHLKICMLQWSFCPQLATVPSSLETQFATQILNYGFEYLSWSEITFWKKRCSLQRLIDYKIASSSLKAFDLS